MSFSISLAKEDFKFNCAHFIALKGFREKLHGHNYKVAVKLEGGSTLCDDGYLIDFGEVKKVVRKICKSLDHSFLVPLCSDCMTISMDDNKPQIEMNLDDGSFFSFPKSDCTILPLAHSSAEEISFYIWKTIVKDITIERLKDRNVDTLEVTVSELPNQSTSYCGKIPESNEAFENFSFSSICRPCLSRD